MTAERDYYEVLGVERGPPATPTSSAPSASSPSSGTRTSTRSRRPRSGSRRSTRPTRSSPIPSAARRTTCSGGPASAAVPGGPATRSAAWAPASAASRTSSTPSSAARQAARGPARPTQPGLRPALRPPDLVRGGGPGRREGDRVPGPRPLRHVRGLRGEGGLDAGPVPAVQRPRRDPVRPPDDARPDGQRRRLPALPRRGQDRREPVRDCSGEGRTERRRSLRVSIPAGIDEGHQIRLTNEGEVGPRGGAPGSLYVAVHVADHPHADARGHGALLRGRPLDRPGGPGHEAPGPDRRRRGRRGRDQARDPARDGDPAARAAACRTCAGTRVRGDLHVIANVVVPTKLSKRQRELLEAYAKEAGETVSGPGLREKLGLYGRRPDRTGAVRRRRLRPWTASTSPRRPPTPGRLAGARRSPPTTRPSRPCREILSRAAPGGTSVEPAFELVEEGLAARVDLARPAMVRAHLPAARRRRRSRAAVDRAERELGHLQAFGLRPIGDLAARVVHEADWANAWKAHFPVLRIGRRIVIRPTWRRHRRAARRRRPRAGPGHGLRDRAAPDDAAVPRGARVAGGPGRARGGRAGRRPGAGPRRGLRLRDPVDRRREARGRARCSRWTWTRSRSRRSAANARRNRLARVDPGPRGERAQRRGAVRRRRSRTSSRRCWSPWPTACVADLRPGRHAARLRHLRRTARRTSSAAFEARGLVVARPLGRGRLGRAGGPPPGLKGTFAALRYDPPSRRGPIPAVRAAEPGPDARPVLALPAHPRDAHHARDRAVRAEPPAAVHAAQPAREPPGYDAPEPGRFVRVLLWIQAHGTVVIGAGLALTGFAMIAVLGPRMLEQPWLLVSLATYAVTAVVAFAIQRPSLRAPRAARRHRDRRGPRGLARAGPPPAVHRLRRSRPRSGSSPS